MSMSYDDKVMMEMRFLEVKEEIDALKKEIAEIKASRRKKKDDEGRAGDRADGMGEVERQ